MVRTLFLIAAAFAMLLSMPGIADAQMRSGGGFGGGGFGGGGLGGSSFGGGMGQSGMGSSFGGSGFGSSAFGSSSSLGNRGFGSSGFGSGGIGGGGFGGSSPMGMGSGFGSGGMGGMGGGMMGTGQGGENFVGRSGSDFTSAMNQMNRNGQQFMQQFGQAMNRGGRGGRNNRGGSQQENVLPPVRVQLDVAFDHTPTAPPVVAANVRARLERILSARNVARPEVTVVGDTVVLRGVAANDSQRMVIGRLVAMEPGVRSVENQMTVAPAPTEESLPAINSLP